MAIDYLSAIVNAAAAHGVDPQIALNLANAESGVNQFRPDGSPVTSSAGAIGIFQLLPSTAAGLGVDPYDPAQNIVGGVSYLAQMYNQFGNWQDALAAYNWGPGNVKRAISSGAPYPQSVEKYVTSILAGTSSSPAIAPDQVIAPDGEVSAPDPAAGVDVPTIALAGAAALALWLLLT